MIWAPMKKGKIDVSMVVSIYHRDAIQKTNGGVPGEKGRQLWGKLWLGALGQKFTFCLDLEPLHDVIKQEQRNEYKQSTH